MPKLWACYEPDLVQYHEDRSVATAVSSEEIGAFLQMTVSEPKEKILSISNGVARIRIEGILSQDGPDLWDQIFGSSGTSYRSIIDAVIEAEEDPDVEQIELLMDTPGGEANGVDGVYEVIAGAEKPVTAINTGLLASAGYWIAAAADKIVATSAVVETGSIGVMVTGIDQSERLEKMGVRVVDIVSENAPNKAPRVSTDAGIEEIRNRVNALERVFISRVAVGRNTEESVVRETFGRGSVLIAQDPNGENNDAISVGMVDSIAYTPTIAKNQNAPVLAIDDSDAGETSEGKNMETENKEILELQDQLEDAKADYADLQTRIAKAKPYLAGSEYPQAIQSLAAKVLEGTVDPAMLEGAVVLFDAQKEAKTEANAVEDSDEIKEPKTQAIDAPVASDDGVIRNELDYKAMIERTRANLGIVR